MRFVSLTLGGYRQFVEPTPLAIPLGITGICGQNGVGKSKVIEAIAYALYGPQRVILPRGDKAADLPSKAVARTVPRVELVLELQGQVYEIVRSPRETYIRLQGAADNLAETSSGVTDKVIELLRLTPGAFQATFVARQREVAGLQAITNPKQRQSLVNRLIGISQVEEAIRLAQEIRKSRESTWQEQVRNNKPTRTEAAAKLEQERVAYAEVLAEDINQTQELEEAKSRHALVLATLSQLEKHVDEVAGLRKRLADLTPLRTAHESARKGAQIRANQAADAAAKLADAGTVLVDTVDAPTQLARREEMARVAELLQRRENLERDLKRRILPLFDRRAQLVAALQEDDTELERLGKERERWTASRSLANQAADQAEAEAERHEQHGQEAKRLGRAGACQACGQVFGDKLEQALDHYAAEAAEATRRESDERSRAAHFAIQEKGVQKLITAREAQRTLRQTKLADYDNVPGEQAQARRDLQAINDELASCPPEALTQPYDPVAYEAAVAEVARRGQAEADVNRLTPLAAQLDGARAEEREATRQIEGLARREQDLKTEITQREPSPELLAEAKNKEALAKVALDEAHQLSREMSGRVAAAKTRVELTEAELAKAEERELSIARAQRMALVAERTEDLLARLLGEITAEARPRLSEMMDTWARALLGPHFRSVDLTEDYRIVADNGSGPHYLEHFSGGEQTLLSVMLRVAISLFCRERAGFDTGFLVLDEVFGDQDGDHRAQLVQFLEEIKPHYHQILVVNHVEDVTNMLDNIIDVVRTGPNSSTAKLRF